MPFTERYVTSGAGGGGTGAATDPWTLAEGFAHAVAGDRVNIQSDAGYSLGATTAGASGTTVSMIVYRGYNSSIGDLDGQGRNADGTLNTTNFPAITLTGTLEIGSYSVLDSLSFTGALSGALLGAVNTPDHSVYSAISCVNTQNNSNAVAARGDNVMTFINSDFECSGAAHSAVITADDEARIIACRIKGEDAATSFATLLNVHAIDSVFYHDGASTAGYGLNIEQHSAKRNLVIGCTFYNLETAIRIPNQAPTYITVIANNHVTDCDEYLDNLYVGTANIAVLEYNNRTRDNTTPRTGIGDGMNSAEVTTDTGDESTDYTDAANENFRLIAAAPGKATGLVAYTDIGAYQREEPASAATAVEVHNTLVTAPWVAESYR